MSADNWAVCPRCSAASALRRQDAIDAAESSYGKVPAEEYLALRTKANVPEAVQETLREDYEIGVSDGVFEVSYSCLCSTCNYVFKFKHDEKLILGKERK